MSGDNSFAVPAVGPTSEVVCFNQKHRPKNDFSKSTHRQSNDQSEKVLQKLTASQTYTIIIIITIIIITTITNVLIRVVLDCIDFAGELYSLHNWSYKHIMS